EFRRRGSARKTPRGEFVQVAPPMSLTAAKADEWLPAAPGAEGLVALGMAHGVIREGLIPGAPPPAFLNPSPKPSATAKGAAPMDDYAPEKTAERTGIPADKLIRIAREFAASRPALAIGGGSAASVAGGVESMRAINSLNVLAGNLNQPGGVLFARDYFD